jgi:hypothetical protein
VSAKRQFRNAQGLFRSDKLTPSSSATPPQFCYLQTGDGSTTPISECSTCAIEEVRLKMEDARSHDADIAASWSATVASCGITAAPLVSPTAVFLPSNQ